MTDVAPHPEDYCRRCGGPNLSWYTPGGTWDPVMRAEPGAPWKWNEIICPPCFASLHEQTHGKSITWALIPMGDDGERWTSADERAAIRSAAVQAAIAIVEEARNA